MAAPVIDQKQVAQLATYVLSQDDIDRFKIAPISQVFVKLEGQTYGPFQDEKLKELIPHFKEIFRQAMIRTGITNTWMYFFEHPLYDRRQAEMRFPPDFDWKNATFSYVAQGQASPSFSLAKLKQFVASGELRPLDHVCIDPGHTWAKICQLPFFNRRGKKNGMALPAIPDEEVFADATRIALARVNQEEHLDATLGEILSANEKANDSLGHLTQSILGKKKSTMALRALSVMAVVVIITACLTPSTKTQRPTVAAAKKAAPMAKVIGIAEGLGSKAKSIAQKASNLSPKLNPSSRQGQATRGIASVISSSKQNKPSASRPTSKAAQVRSTASTARTAQALPTPKQYKVAPIKSPTTVYGNPTRQPHLLPESERQNLDYDGTLFTKEEAAMAAYCINSVLTAMRMKAD